MGLTLHHHPLSSYCHKVAIGLYELEAPFETRMVNPGDPEAKAAFVALWPTGKIPLLVDEAAGKVVPETSIMLEYAERAAAPGKTLLPADPDLRLEARLWDRLFDCYVMTPVQKIVADRQRPENQRDPRGVAEARTTLDMAYRMIDSSLEGRSWAAGAAFTVADCAAAPALFYAGILAPFPPELARLSAYFERLIARPSVRRVIDDARPYLAFFPFRELIPPRFLESDTATA